jgi:hypothetical protein
MRIRFLEKDLLSAFSSYPKKERNSLEERKASHLQRKWK